MGTCRDCVYGKKQEGILGSWYCTFTTDRHGYFINVSASHSCDHFEERPSVGKTNSDCFLTSAMVDYYGKADDCEELTVLRSFRDSYMRKSADGDKLIKEYYEVAPKIVECINASGKKEKNYQYISEVVDKCVKLIALQENERALTEYKFMVENLSKEFEPL